jgi:hypothetical protein
MDRDKISNLYRGPSIKASYQASFIWQNGFRGEDFLEINQSETRLARAFIGIAHSVLIR